MQEKWELLSDLKHATRNVLDRTHKCRELLMFDDDKANSLIHLEALEKELITIYGDIEFLIEKQED